MDVVEAAYRRWIRTPFPPPTEERLAVLERSIGVTFPDDYRRFLLRFNGGYFTEPQIVPPPGDDCPVDRLTYLSGVGASHPVAELATPNWLDLFDDNDPPRSSRLATRSWGTYCSSSPTRRAAAGSS